MNLKAELEQEEDGRWIAEVPDLPGVLGASQDEVRAKPQALALRVLAVLSMAEASPQLLSISFTAA